MAGGPPVAGRAGYDSTLDYLRACAVAVLEETGLLPHLNPGVLTWSELQRLKPVAPSMGMMLETTATRLWSEPGGPHYGSPDKEPAVRLRVLDDAGRVGVPFTTGILIGIGEDRAERVDAIFAIRRAMREYGHLQEVIVQNFRAKPDTAMRGMPDAELHDLAATVAVARVLLGPKARIQAPPNLIAGEYDLLLRAGIDDWGGVSRSRPTTSTRSGLAAPGRAGGAYRECRVHAARAADRLPGYVRAGEPWLDPRLLPHVTALADPATGLAVEAARRRDGRGRSRRRSTAAAPTCTSPSTSPAVPTTGGATSTACTATGPRWPARWRRRRAPAYRWVPARTPTCARACGSPPTTRRRC
ncbi:7,8-didemethyl-8-hydroxy-5-deazariboflavin synthase CofG [Micromonospora sp. BRA006-A]|nr:7,8-didemethyl-8-hydroxy-5-deazariboflavin synthase CofG [Micromonospora sp. BRA006-A]